MPEIQKLSHKHEAILQHMLANPLQKLSEVAAAFQVSQPWLSCIIHSDAFQRQLQERQDTVFNTTVLPLRDKMNLVAHKMLDKIIEAPMEAIDLDTASNVAESMLDRLGFSPKQPLQVNPPEAPSMTAGKALLEQARGLIGVKSKMTVTTTLEVENNAQLPAETRQHQLGSVSERGSLPAIEGEYTEPKKGTGV